VSESFIRFLTVDDVITLHAIAIEDQSGDSPIRDRNLLESAVAMPRQGFGGQYVHESIPAMAAAYAFHLCMNHPFVDGNKRAAFAALLAFLVDNGWRLAADNTLAEQAVVNLAAGSTSKEQFTAWVSENAHPTPDQPT